MTKPGMSQNGCGFLAAILCDEWTKSHESLSLHVELADQLEKLTIDGSVDAPSLQKNLEKLLEVTKTNLAAMGKIISMTHLAKAQFQDDFENAVKGVTTVFGEINSPLNMKALAARKQLAKSLQTTASSPGQKRKDNPPAGDTYTTPQQRQRTRGRGGGRGRGDGWYSQESGGGHWAGGNRGRGYDHWSPQWHPPAFPQEPPQGGQPPPYMQPPNRGGFYGRGGRGGRGGF